MSLNGPILVLDTATRTPVLALARPSGELIAERRWHSRHRHGEELLEQLNGLLDEAGTERDAIAAVVAGTGPGSFTGLRIGLATAKVIAYSLGVPLAGVSTTTALAAAVAGDGRAIAVTLPAGASDRYVHVFGGAAQSGPELVVPGDPFDRAVAGVTLVAIDLDAPDLPAEAVERGRSALAGLAGALASLGLADLDAGRNADPAMLVPAYVALPRGIARAAAEMQWSPDLR